MPRKIIIDTDPGIDDAMAIFFALESPELDVIGLTTVFGNVHTSLATENALRLLEIAGRTDIPVAGGATQPLVAEFEGPVPLIHGENGQGDIELAPITTKAIDQSAPDFIIEQVMRQSGEVTLVPVGPLTNIALALRLEPRIQEHVREVVLMGGNAFVPGNASPAAEANIRNDPEAADIVFGANWQVTMVGLDVTHEVLMPADQIARYGQASSPMAQHVFKIVQLYLDFFRGNINLNGIYIHDSSAIAYLIEPGLFTVEHYPVRVETQGIGRGKTWCARVPFVEEEHLYDRVPEPWQNRPLVNVCVGVDGAKVVELELSRMT